MRRRLGALCRSGCCDSIQLQGWIGQGATGVSPELKSSQHHWRRTVQTYDTWGSVHVAEKHVERGPGTPTWNLARATPLDNGVNNFTPNTTAGCPSSIFQQEKIQFKQTLHWEGLSQDFYERQSCTAQCAMENKMWLVTVGDWGEQQKKHSWLSAVDCLPLLLRMFTGRQCAKSLKS